MMIEPRSPLARRRRHTASPSRPGMVTSSTTRSGAERLGGGQRGAAVGDVLDLEALGRQAAGEHAPHERVVVDHEHPLGHRSAARDVAAQEDEHGGHEGRDGVERAHPRGAHDRRPVDRRGAAAPARR
jgi:hypothetical protein